MPVGIRQQEESALVPPVGKAAVDVVDLPLNIGLPVRLKVIALLVADDLIRGVAEEDRVKDLLNVQGGGPVGRDLDAVELVGVDLVFVAADRGVPVGLLIADAVRGGELIDLEPVLGVQQRDDEIVLRLDPRQSRADDLGIGVFVRPARGN